MSTGNRLLEGLGKLDPLRHLNFDIWSRRSNMNDLLVYSCSKINWIFKLATMITIFEEYCPNEDNNY
ncbi:MAG TPA: hypothetical protein DEV81_00925 [Cyanobacteria bacterium UBA11049]|nr:hypothetical protein [Cyanobacteria bacterium UBA11049]